MSTTSKVSKIKTTTDAAHLVFCQLEHENKGPICTPVATAAKHPVPQASLPIGPRRKDEAVAATSSSSSEETLTPLRTKGVAKRLALQEPERAAGKAEVTPQQHRLWASAAFELMMIDDLWDLYSFRLYVTTSKDPSLSTLTIVFVCFEISSIR
ncbi:hypothetical protein V8E53_010885 [Lactarius tabidus]